MRFFVGLLVLGKTFGLNRKIVPFGSSQRVQLLFTNLIKIKRQNVRSTPARPKGVSDNWKFGVPC